MKGLLLKDFYMAAKYCRAFLLLVIVFLAVSIWGDENVFFVIYPVLIAGMIPVTLYSYDEREKWTLYSGTLPYTRTQFVSSKYLVGLFFETAVFHSYSNFQDDSIRRFFMGKAFLHCNDFCGARTARSESASAFCL